MKRDMDLVREILQFMEGSGGPLVRRVIMQEKIPMVHDRSDLFLHLDMMEDAGLVARHDSTKEAWRLCWDGYEFLDTSRDQGTWNKAKAEVIDKAKGLPFAVLMNVLTVWLTKAVVGGA